MDRYQQTSNLESELGSLMSNLRTEYKEWVIFKREQNWMGVVVRFHIDRNLGKCLIITGSHDSVIAGVM